MTNKFVLELKQYERSSEALRLRYSYTG